MPPTRKGERPRASSDQSRPRRWSRRPRTQGAGRARRRRSAKSWPGSRRNADHEIRALRPQSVQRVPEPALPVAPVAAAREGDRLEIALHVVPSKCPIRDGYAAASPKVEAGDLPCRRRRYCAAQRPDGQPIREKHARLHEILHRRKVGRAASPKTLDVINPATEAVAGKISLARPPTSTPL